MAELLVVDDDTDLGELLGEVLRAAGHRVRVAHDGADGLAQLSAHPPDLVLLDVEMPSLTGPEVAYRMFVHNLGLERVPVVLLSGVLDLPRVASMVGTRYFLAKPYTPRAVLRLVERALTERAAPHPLTGG